MSLELKHAFGIARIVGMPAAGRRRFGVPVGGAFDRESFLLANSLLGRSPAGLMWELGMAAAQFEVQGDGQAAVVGARATVTLDGRELSTPGSFPVSRGQRLEIAAPTMGARVYLAFASGIPGPARRLYQAPSSLTADRLRVVAGPQAALTGPLKGSFRVMLASNRVGLRLEGGAPPHEIEMASEPTCPGVIQVSRSGELLLLGPDGPTIGGYPKAAVVIDADLDRVGQLRPGDGVEFSYVSLEEARELRSERLAHMARLTAAIRTAV